MTRNKWLLLGFISILLCALILVLIPSLIKSIQLASIPHPPNVPKSWKPHQGGLGIFQVWLPRGWKDVKKGRIGLLLKASMSDKEGYEWITVRNYDPAFEGYAPLVGKELARECSSSYPVSLTLDFDGGIPVDATNVVMIERKGDGIDIAYQSAALVREMDGNLVRTVAFVVSEKHVFMISLDTYEGINENGPALYEKILNAFYVTD
ncbi:MAG: hypothetical protein GY832_32625 [Chloroflexi bacterium]|nr:hypothetical protein [Chloroflexota bacterium]